MGTFNAVTIDWCSGIYASEASVVMTTTTKEYISTSDDLDVLAVVFEQTFPAGLPAPVSPSPPPKPPNGTCDMYRHTDFNGPHFSAIPAVSATECCQKCLAIDKCQYFTFYTGPATKYGNLTLDNASKNGTCCLKTTLGRKLVEQAHHTAGICHGGNPPDDDWPNQTTLASSFPTFTQPSGGRPAPPLNAFTFWGPSGMFTELTRLWSPGALQNHEACNDIGNDKGCDGMGPLVIYSNSSPPTTLVVSAFTEMLVHQASASGSDIGFGLRGTLLAIPPGFSLSTILVGGTGVTATTRAWGRLLLRSRGRENRVTTRGVYDRDPSLRYLSYWTDAGAAYYYATERNRTYEDTMKDVKAWMHENRVPTRVYQLDSWWYFKNHDFPGSPVSEWSPMPSIFPDGFQPWFDSPSFGLEDRTPLVMHNRAFDPHSVYNKSWFILEDMAALPQDKALYLEIMNKAKPLGLKVYEQDWMCLTHMRMRATQQDVHAAKRWLTAMDEGAKEANLTIQMCMQYSRHVLHTIEMDAVTQARASTDYHPVNQNGCKLGAPNPTCTQWNIGLTSLFYSALGIIPSKDNFRTSVTSTPREPNPLLQALVAGLSGGPVGPSDAIGFMDFAVVHHICRGPDGYLNKPHKPATPLDVAFNMGFADAASEGLDSLPTVWDAYTTLNGSTWHYVLAVNLQLPVVLRPSDLYALASASRHVAFEYFPECWRDVNATKTGVCTFEHGPGHTSSFNASSPLVLRPGGVKGNNFGDDANATPFRYVVTAPIFPSGFVLLGETGKFFVATEDRFSDLRHSDDGFSVTVMGGLTEPHVNVVVLPPGAMDVDVGERGVLGPVDNLLVRCCISEHTGQDFRRADLVCRIDSRNCTCGC